MTPTRTQRCLKEEGREQGRSQEPGARSQEPGGLYDTISSLDDSCWDLEMRNAKDSRKWLDARALLEDWRTSGTGQDAASKWCSGNLLSQGSLSLQNVARLLVNSCCACRTYPKVNI